jgi:hypothetical protein
LVRGHVLTASLRKAATPAPTAQAHDATGFISQDVVSKILHAASKSFFAHVHGVRLGLVWHSATISESNPRWLGKGVMYANSVLDFAFEPSVENSSQHGFACIWASRFFLHVYGQAVTLSRAALRLGLSMRCIVMVARMSGLSYASSENSGVVDRCSTSACQGLLSHSSCLRQLPPSGFVDGPLPRQVITGFHGIGAPIPPSTAVPICSCTKPLSAAT